MTDMEDTFYHVRVSGTSKSTISEIYDYLDVKDPLKMVHTLPGVRL